VAHMVVVRHNSLRESCCKNAFCDEQIVEGTKEFTRNRRTNC
jgi:hypothetical protein